MIRVKLRDAIDSYQQRHGRRFTYEQISELTSISCATLQSLAARPDYNTRLSTLDKLCHCLDCQPGDLLEFEKNEEVEK